MGSEDMIDGANDVVVQEDSVKGAVPRYEWDNLINTCVEEINKMLDSSDVGMVHDTLRALKERLRLLRDGDMGIIEEKQNNDIQKRLDLK